MGADKKQKVMISITKDDLAHVFAMATAEEMNEMMSQDFLKGQDDNVKADFYMSFMMISKMLYGRIDRIMFDK